MILKGWKFFYYLNSLYFNYIQQSITQQKQVGSLTGAVHLRKNSAGEPRRAQWEEKSHVELKGKSPLDLVFQCENKRGNCVLSILCVLRRTSAQRCQKGYHRDNWLVAAKRPKRRSFLILRCRLFSSFRCRRRKVSDCSPVKEERELGLDHRETG